MSRQVRVSQKQITDSKSFSVPPHLFVWVTVGSTLEWFHQKLNSCLTGLICLHYCEKKRCVSTFIIQTQICIVLMLQRWERCLYSKQQSAQLCGGPVCQSSFFFLWQNNNYDWQLSPLEWACCMDGNLNLLECPAFVLDDVRWAHIVGVCRLGIFWM